MNKSFSSSSPTPPPVPFRPTSLAATATRLTPAVIPLEYNYHIMSPSTYTNTLTRPRTTTRDSVNLESFQYSSIYGDPVPTAHPVEFFGSETENGLFRASYSHAISSDEDNKSSHLFPALRNTPSGYSRRSSSNYMSRNFEILSGSSIPRLKPPDIQILPNSSGESGSEALGSPNFSLLRPEEVQSTSALYENIPAVDINEVLETVTISDATGVREYTEAKRRVSNVSDDFKSNVGTNCHKDAETTTRRGSNESYSSEDWFRPATRGFPEFSKMPKMRPSSKNVMLIKNNEMPTQFSPVAAMFNDSSSGDEHLADPLGATTELPKIRDLNIPERPPAPTEMTLKHLSDLSTENNEQSYFKSYPLADPLPPPPPLQKNESTEILQRLMSPAIKTNLIATGGDHRVATPRLHKKTSFTILPEKSPYSSRAVTPNDFSQRQQFPSAKPVAMPRYSLPTKSMSSIQLKLPQITQQNQYTFDDSPRPSVQFDMTGRYSPTKMPAKGILQHRESLSSSQEALPQTKMRLLTTLPGTALPLNKHKHRSYEALPMVTDPYRTAIPRLNRSAFDINREPAIFPPGALPRPLRPNPNPTRKHKGLLRVINREEILSKIPLRSNWNSMDDLVFKRRMRPPIQRRRSSSTSPERRSSTQTGSDRRSSNLSSITTSDFSFRRSSLISNNNNNNFKRRNSMIKPPITAKRRQSVISNNMSHTFAKNKTRTKISKPTTLSPIIGTPNKDSSSSQSPVRMMLPTGPTSESFSDTSRRESLSRIPVRKGSQSNSRAVSRSTSPNKELPIQLTTSGRTSQTTSYRSPSRGSVRNDSITQLNSRSTSRSNSRAGLRNDSLTQPNSLSPSRSTSRAGLRNDSLTQPNSLSPSRSTSRAGLRNDSLIQPYSLSPSRSNSRVSLRNDSLTQFNSHSPSASNTRASTRPRSQAQSRSSSRQSSRLEQTNQMINSRSTSRNIIKSTPRTVHGSLSPQRRYTAIPTTNRKSSSLSPQMKPRGTKSNSPTKSRLYNRNTSREKSASKRNSRSRIPRRASVTSGSSKSPPKSRVSVLLNKKSSPIKSKPIIKPKETVSAKKATSSAIKPESSVKRTPSSIVKQKPGTTKQPNVAKKTEKDMKKDDSKKKTVKNEPNKKTKGTEKPKNSGKPLTKIPSNKSLNNKSAGDGGNKKQIMAGEELKAIGANAGKLGAIGTVAAGTAVAAAIASNTSDDTESETAKNMASDGTASIKRTPSTMSLMRMGSRMSLFGKKRPDSSLSRRITEEELSDSMQTPLTPDAAAILEKSQKTLEDVQKTVTVATDKIQKTMKTNLTDLKTMEMDAGKALTSTLAEELSPASSAATVIENTAAKVKDVVTAPVSPLPSGQPIEADVSVVNGEQKKNATSERVSERAISVLPEVESESANLQNFELDVSGKSNAAMAADGVAVPSTEVHEPHSDDFKVDGKRRSPDGQGGSTAGSGAKTGSEEEFLRHQEEDEKPKGCCGICNKFCMPCRRARCSQCCRRKKDVHLDDSEEPVISARSSATTTHLEVIDEKAGKSSCWSQLNCCRRTPHEHSSAGSTRTMEMKEETVPSRSTSPPKQSKCGLCLSKIFCCRAVNRVDTTTGDETQVKKCCFCIPCRGKKRSRTPPLGSAASSVAWQDPEQAIAPTDASVLEGITTQSRDGCCKRFWSGIFCCCRKKKAPVAPGSRRQSIKPPPPEDTRRKLHVDLVEFNSKMKGAIPVLPLYLAWFCAICNTVFPGLGTLLSGFFCVCVGIPRFSHYDSAKARLGSFIINTIVACAQLFCVLFCFVGWGWSIWWGTIMLKCAKKFSKIKKVERLEMEEERRQQQMEAEAREIAARSAANVETTETTKT